MLSPIRSLDCRDAESSIHLYLDEEVAPEDRAALEHHLAECSRCADLLGALRLTREALQRQTLAEAPPAALEARLREDLARASQGERGRRGLLLVPAACAALALGVSLWPERAAPAASPRAPFMLSESLSHHTLDVPVDVASPDAVRVEAFLAPRVGQRMSVPRLDAAGFGLAGGRVISVDNRRAAHLTYEGGLGRRVTVVAVPDPDGRFASSFGGAGELALTGYLQGTDALASGVRRRAGEYGVHVWSERGTLYSLVAQLDDARLDEVVTAMHRGHPAQQIHAAVDADPPVR